MLRFVSSALYLAGQVERGHDCARRACALMPGVAGTQATLAHACLAANRVAEGHAALDAFERLAPGSAYRATPLVARVRLYLVEGRLTEAFSALQEVFLLAPGDTAAQFDEVIVLELLGRRDDAIRALTRYRKQMPSRTLESTLAIVRCTRPRAPNLQAQVDSLSDVWRALEGQGRG